MNPGQEVGARPSVVAGAVAQRVAVLRREPGQDQNVVAEGLQGLQDPGELEVGARGRGGPVRLGDAVGHIDEGKAERLAAPARRGEGRGHGVQHGEGHRGPHAPEDRAARQVLARDGSHDFTRSARRIWNGRLVTISRTRAEKR